MVWTATLQAVQGDCRLLQEGKHTYHYELSCRVQSSAWLTIAAEQLLHVHTVCHSVMCILPHSNKYSLHLLWLCMCCGYIIF